MSETTTGIVLAFTALLCWGFGDFYIQRSTRAVGVWKSLFFNDMVAVLALSPFVYKELPHLTTENLLFLGFLSLIVVFAAIFDFTALQEGKIAIVEPLLGIELPVTVGLSILFRNELLTGYELILITITFFGVVLASTTRISHLHYHRRLLERGVLLAGFGAIAMGVMNFLVGVSSVTLSPLLTVWFFSAALALVSFCYMGYNGELATLGPTLKKHWKITAQQSIIDNAAWIAYAGATVFIPISIATTISESYIAIAVLLGIAVNRETVVTHQKVGVAAIIVAITLLAIATQ